MKNGFRADESFALDLDRSDPLAGFRGRFHTPAGKIYMNGNSLGPLSRDSESTLLRVLDEWKGMGIGGWLEGSTPWFHYAEKLGGMAAGLVGARPEEVVATGTTTLNIHSLTGTFYRPGSGRRKIIAGALDFPTDIYALQSQIRLAGLDPAENLVLVPSCDGRTIEEDRVVEMVDEGTSLVFLPSVLYRSGQLLDMARLTEEAHARGAAIGFDCSHSVGSVPHSFDEWGVDFAVWCGYKYMNAGPGSPAFLYLNGRHFQREPALAGWFGCVKEKQFDMELEFEHELSAGGWQISSPGILAAGAAEGALAVTLEAGIGRIREESLKMTSYLIRLADELLSPEPYRFGIGTPREGRRRGGHVALERKEDALRINEALKARGVVTDFRPPNIIRIAPVPLYNTYQEIWRIVFHLKEIIEEKEYERFSDERGAIT